MIADGSYHDVYDLKPQSFSLENIAIALGNLTRWGGHLGTLHKRDMRNASPIRGYDQQDIRFKSNFYSVAEHSVIGAKYHLHKEEKELAKLFLLHDAAEPFVGGDIPTPLKNHLPKIFDWEKSIQDILIDSYNLKGSFEDIKETDKRICRNECIGLYDDEAEWALDIQPLCYENGFDRTLIKLHKWSPQQAMNEWYTLATKLGLKNKYA